MLDDRRLLRTHETQAELREHTDRIAAEFFMGFEAVEKIDRPAVSAPHRAAALDACREAIDTLKETIPLWKKEVYSGGEEWIGRGS